VKKVWFDLLFYFTLLKHYYMTGALNTENREYITWQYEQLNFALLGSLKIEELERMRVTLKMEYTPYQPERPV
jgi:hypothetical protein